MFYVLGWLKLLHSYLNRAEWLLHSICFYTILIGLTIILVKKYMDKKKIYKIPKSNITPISNYSTKQQFEISTFLNSTRTILMKSANIADNQPRVMPLLQPLLNTSAKNNSLLSFSGVLILTIDFVLIICFALGSRRGWITLDQSEICMYVHFLCTPVVLPIIYFMRNQNHLVVVLKDLNLL